MLLQSIGQLTAFKDRLNIVKHKEAPRKGKKGNAKVKRRELRKDSREQKGAEKQQEQNQKNDIILLQLGRKELLYFCKDGSVLLYGFEGHEFHDQIHGSGKRAKNREEVGEFFDPAHIRTKPPFP